jgi:isoleucyl-tRNA synthetase
LTATVLAPIVPFLTEEIWQNAVRGLLPDVPESVHHELWPVVPADWADERLLGSTERVRAVISLGLNLRNQVGLRVRQPLPEFFVVCQQKEDVDAINEQVALIQSELNVKRVTTLDSSQCLYRPTLALRPKEAGPVLRDAAQRVKALLRDAGPEVMADLVESFESGGPVSIPGYDQPLTAELLARENVEAAGLKVSESGSVTVALNTVVDAELRREGIARDLLRQVQVLRRDSGLGISQRIEVGFATDSDQLLAAVNEHRAYIASELLATRLTDEPIGQATATADVEIDGATMQVTLRPVSTTAESS